MGSDNLEAILGTDGFVYPLAWPEEESDAALAPTAEESVKDKAGQQGAFNERSKVHWSDVIANERGVFALSTSSPAEICFFSDISHLCSFDRSGTDNASSSSSASPTAEEARAEENKNGVIRIQCPPSPNLQLFTTEHRAFLYCGAQPPSPHTSSSNAPIAGGGGMNILLEVDIKTSPPGFLPIQVDALSFTVVPGSANRLGILSDMGEAWVMGSRTRDLDLEVIPSDEEAREGEGEQGQDGTPADDSMGSSDDSGSQGESLSDGGETHLMGLGSDFTLLVRDDGVWVKGDSELSCANLICTLPPSELAGRGPEFTDNTNVPLSLADREQMRWDNWPVHLQNYSDLRRTAYSQ